MADETPFNKLHVEPSVKGDLTGLLEQFNLPPNVIKFIRKNLKVIYVVLALMVIAILSWSAYDAYIQKRINMSSSALTNALKEPAAVRPARRTPRRAGSGRTATARLLAWMAGASPDHRRPHAPGARQGQ